MENCGISTVQGGKFPVNPKEGCPSLSKIPHSSVEMQYDCCPGCVLKVKISCGNKDNL